MYVADVRWLRPVHFHGDVHDDRGEYDCEWYSTMNFFTNLVQPYVAAAVAKNRRGHFCRRPICGAHGHEVALV